MKALFLAVVAVSVPAFAQINIQVQLPSISFQAPPPLVVAEPGVQVVADSDDEVFFVDNWFWHRRGGSWFRTRTHTGGWANVDSRSVPQVLIRLPVGRYRRWRGEVHTATPIANAPPPPPNYNPPPQAPPPQQAPPPSQDVVHVKEIRAERIYARVIYCKEIKARDGRIGRQGGRQKGKDDDWGGKELRVTELRADTIYAKEIHADWIEADEVYCKEVKLGR